MLAILDKLNWTNFKNTVKLIWYEHGYGEFLDIAKLFFSPR